MWESLDELGRAYGLGIGSGCVLGAMIALFNSWRV
jgi:hypothetical protein